MQEEESDDNVEVSVKELQELRKLKTKTESTTGDKYQRDPTFGDFAHFAYANEGNCAHTSTFSLLSQPDRILVSGASKHVAGTSNEFELYTQYPPTLKETIKQLMAQYNAHH